MILDTPSDHLKQQMSVTQAASWAEKVHKVGQLSGLALLVVFFLGWHLG